MDAELLMGIVAYWFGFTSLAGLHFFVKNFKSLQNEIVTRLWRLALSLLLMVGPVSAAFFGGYVNRTFPASDVFAKGFLAGIAMYALFAWLWTRNVKRFA